MKILFIDQISTVNYKYSFSIIERLSAKNDIIFVSDEKKYEGEGIISYEYFKGTTSKEISKFKKAIIYIKAWKKIFELCKVNKIDIIHVQWFILSPVDSYFIKKIKKIGVKIVVTVHDILPFNEKFYDYKSHKEIYTFADKIIVQAKPNIDRINSIFSNVSKKVLYIPHGNFIDHAQIISKEDARNLLGIDRNKKVLLFFGQIKRVKGLDVLIKAFNEIIKSKEGENILLVIAGKVWEDDFSVYEQLINEVDNSKFRCDIKYIPDDQIAWYYCSADINILPYREVYQSGVVHLSYAYEKPVIATNIGSFPEVIIDKETGLLVEKDNYNELKDAILSLIHDDKIMKKMGIDGKRYIRNNFSWDVITDEIENIYYNLK
ncbi:glycosyltransferase family 4 protein [Clostridium tertium]|uniref:glycosyltransferase family 4 protein n=1 Tax=Clostridium tertium TaxID=1559 RepID=UPI00290450B7|nr:glycosyltransferase family 4 protein [Clostridium sp.]